MFYIPDYYLVPWSVGSYEASLLAERSRVHSCSQLETLEAQVEEGISGAQAKAYLHHFVPDHKGLVGESSSQAVVQVALLTPCRRFVGMR